MCKKKTHDEYVIECKEQNLDPLIDREDNRYINAKIKLYHKCKISDHKPYLQKPNHHLRKIGGGGCRVCGHIRSSLSQRKSHTTYVNECKNKNLDPPADIPENVYKGDNKHLYHKCKNSQHEPYLQVPTHHLKGKGCSLCINKTEAKIYNTLKHLFSNDSIFYQFKADWCKNLKTNKYYIFDFLLKDYKLIIECDGRQHFEIVDRFKNNITLSQQIDTYKQNRALVEGYSVLRLYQPDVWNDKIDWKQAILDTIELIKLDSTPSIYVASSNNDMYENYHPLKIEFE